MWHLLPTLGLVATAVSCVAPPLRLAVRLRRYARGYPRQAPADQPKPRALVILPCKGQADELRDLEDNLRGVLEQDYPSYRVVFAVGDPEDLALPTLRKLCDEYDHASLVQATHRKNQSQKISNQLKALEQAGPDDDVLVFFDSDARPAPDQLANLVAPLTDPQIGATTGFRWYTPVAGGLGSWLRAAWNVAGMPFLAEDRLNYAWGGAMAIRRETFEACGIAEYWASALSDDLGLSLLVKQSGLRITLVPLCLIRSPEDLTMAGTLEWTNRQTVILRVYNPAMWRSIFFGEGLTLATVIAGAAMAIAGANAGSTLYAAAGLVAMATIVFGRMAFQASVLGTAKRLSPQLVSTGSTWRLTLLAPCVIPLTVCNSLRSWLSRKITWRGIRYHMIGPTQIEVF